MAGMLILLVLLLMVIVFWLIGNVIINRCVLKRARSVWVKGSCWLGYWLILFAVFFGDEVIARRILYSLCDEEAGSWIYKKAYDVDGYFLENYDVMAHKSGVGGYGYIEGRVGGALMRVYKERGGKSNIEEISNVKSKYKVSHKVDYPKYGFKISIIQYSISNIETGYVLAEKNKFYLKYKGWFFIWLGA